MVFRQETNLYDDNAIAKKFSSQDTKFEVVQGKISYLISDSEIEEYGSGKGTVTSRLNTAESNIDGNSSLISSLTTQYDTLSGEVTAYESSTNEYKQTTNQTISTITQTVSTKTRTFNTQPTPPYSVNDLWLKDRDLYVCTVAKTSGQSFAETDWTLATKYTSDAALTQFIENTYASDKTTLQNQIDGKIETWNQADDPSTAWATTTEKGNHTGDLWYRTSDNTTWRYTGSQWVQQDVPTAVIGAINGKAVLWTTQPQPPYTTNDLWVQGSSGDIMKCVNARASGSYVSSDWAKASKYTDDTVFNNWKGNTSYVTFQSFIDQLPNQINLTVEASGRYAAKASIIAEINESTESSSVKIKADRLTFDGDTVINAVNNGTGTVSINADKINLSAYSTKTYAESLVTQSAEEINTRVSGLENIKNACYSGSGVPTSSNYPASSWTTNSAKVNHAGDLYYDESTGYTYQYKVTARGLLVTFNSQSQTEAASYDYVVIYYKVGDSYYCSDKIGGSSIAGQTFFIPAREFWVYWHTDSSNNNYYGFAFDPVTVKTGQPVVGVFTDGLPDYTVTSVSDISQIASSHSPYENSANQLWKYTHSSSISISFTGAWVRRKDSDLTTAESSITQLSGEITLKVSKGDIASTINQTAQSVLISASKVNLSGYATFTDLSTAGSTTINGSNITTGSISANRIKGDTLTLGGSNNTNGKLVVKDASNVQIGYWDNTGINITKGSINIGSGKFSVNTSGAFSVDSDYLTISNGSIFTRSSNSTTAERSSKYEKGDLYWYYQGTEIAKIHVSGTGSGLLRIDSKDLWFIGNNSLISIGNKVVAIRPYGTSSTNTYVAIERRNSTSISNERSYLNVGLVDIRTDTLTINGRDGVSGTYTFGSRSVRITNGIITSVT